MLSGLTDLTVLKSTGSEFKGFLKDRFTTLAETDDRVLATSLTGLVALGPRRVRADWDASYDRVRAVLLETFATTYSRALQETLQLMGTAALEAAAGSGRDPVLGARTSTTSSSTSRRSGWTTRARCSTPTTGRTA